MPSIESVLFVCAGNICRSPLAEAVFRDLARSRPALARMSVGSAGVVATTGASATPEAIAAAGDTLGLDISGHRARSLEGLDADLIFVVDRWVERQVSLMELSGRVELIGEYAGVPGDIADPYGCDAETYRDCASNIRELIQAVVERLESEVTPR
jgi:protein-tyrosine-phosphatase